MRILSVGSLPPRFGGPTHGGVATFHAALLDGLRQAGDVDVVGVAPPAPLERDIGLPVYTRPQQVGAAEFYEGLLERLRPDAVVMNHFAHTIGVTHARLGAPVPAVGVAHSWHNITLRSGEQRRRARAVTTEALAGLRAVVFVSEHTRREGESLGMPYPERAETIHPPLPPFYSSAAPDLHGRRRAGIAYLGSLIERKRPQVLAEAAARLPRAPSVTFAGHGELEGELREAIRRLGLSERARIAHLDDHAVRELLLGAQTMCMPSASETFGLAYIEALSCGAPVVGFGPTLREIREEMGIEIGEPLGGGGPEEVAAALERVLSTAWDRAQLRRATLQAFGLRRAAERFARLFLSLERSRPAAAAGGRRVERLPTKDR